MRLIVALALGLSLTAAAVPADAPKDAAAAITSAEELYQAGRYHEARRELLAAYKKGDTTVDLAVRLAEVEMHMALAADAEAHLAAARLQEPRNPDVLFWSALSASEAGNTPRSAEYIKGALDAAGDSEVPLYDMAEKYLRRSVPSVAAAIYEKIISIYPADSQFDVFCYLNLSSYYHFTGRNALAAEIMARAKRPLEYGDFNLMTPQEADYWVAIYSGLGKIDSGDSDAGIAMLRDAAAVFPIGVVADAFVVKCLDDSGAAAEAEAVYNLLARRLKENIAEAPENADAYHDFALVAALSGRGTQTALKYCRMALALAPLAPEYLHTRSVLLFRLGRYDEALTANERAMALISAPRWAEPGFFLHLVWQRLDTLEKTGAVVPGVFRELPKPEAPPAPSR